MEPFKTFIASGAYKDAPAPPVQEGTLAYRASQLREANALLRDMASQAEGLASRIAGSTPTGESGQKPSPVPNGLLDEFDQINDDYRAQTVRLGDALNRLQNSI